MARNLIYKITVKNWEKYNSRKKEGHRQILLHVGFLADAKIQQLSPATTLLFLSCMLLAGESAQSQFEVTHESLCFHSRVKSGSLQSQLAVLEELQLVTIEKIEPLKNRIEKKIREKKGIELTAGNPRTRREVAEALCDLIDDKLTKPQIIKIVGSATSAAPSVHIGKELVGFYCETWTERYGAKPPIRPQDAKHLKTLGQSNGLQRTKDLLRAYLSMNESWFVQKRHDLATFSNNLTAVAQFLETGRTLTRADLKVIDSASNLENTLREIQEKGV